LQGEQLFCSLVLWIDGALLGHDHLEVEGFGFSLELLELALQLLHALAQFFVLLLEFFFVCLQLRHLLTDEFGIGFNPLPHPILQGSFFKTVSEFLVEFDQLHVLREESVMLMLKRPEFMFLVNDGLFR